MCRPNGGLAPSTFLMALLDGVRRTIRRHNLAGATTRVAVALSGGGDSVALLHLLKALDAAGELRLSGVVHFNHQLRASADDDEAFCAALADRLELPFISDRADVRALARAEQRSLEDAARTARHAFFERAAARLHADVVALGHTRDDQAETFLLRLLRGAGGRGLSGMHPRTGIVVRPLLDIHRADLQRYLDEEGLQFREDESNADTSIPRNRIRHEVLPLLADRFNPRVVDALASEAELWRAQQAHLDDEAGRWLAVHARFVAGQAFLGAAALAALPRALARVVAHTSLNVVASASAASFDDVERVLEVASGSRPAFDASGARVERVGAEVVLSARRPETSESRKGAHGANLFQYPLSIPGEVQIVETGGAVSAELASGWSGGIGPASIANIQVPSGIELSVRNRRPGDRFWPLGAPGRKKLHDFFIDRKVARTDRDSIPLVVDAADRIVWVAGHAVDQEFRVKDPAQSVIILRLKGVGGSA